MKNYHKEGLEFRLGEDVLFEVSRFVSDIDSRIFYDLVLQLFHDWLGRGQSTLLPDDCFPAQFINDEHTKANIKEECHAVGDLHPRYLEQANSKLKQTKKQ